MSVAVMWDYYYPDLGPRQVADSNLRVQNWMLAQMAQYPPPPQPDQQHYNALYPAPAGTHQLISPQEQLQYSNLNQPAYPNKIESIATDQASSGAQITALTHELQQHAGLGQQQQHHIHPPSQQVQQHSIHDPSSGTPHSSQPQTHQGTPDQSSKANRLRKACDSCSIRKVKVG